MAKSWYRNPWIIGTGTTVLASVVLDLFKIIPVWKTLRAVFAYSVPTPLVVLVLLALFSLLFIIRAILRRHKIEYSPSNAPPSKYSITKKEIFGVFWQYHMDPTRSGRFAWVDHPICPKCKNELDYAPCATGPTGLQLVCSYCSFSTVAEAPRREDLEERVRREIERRDRVGEPPPRVEDENYDPLRHGLRP